MSIAQGSTINAADMKMWTIKNYTHSPTVNPSTYTEIIGSLFNVSAPNGYTPAGFLRSSSYSDSRIITGAIFTDRSGSNTVLRVWNISFTEFTSSTFNFTVLYLRTVYKAT